MIINTVQSRIGGESFWCDRIYDPRVISKLEQYAAKHRYSLIHFDNCCVMCHSTHEDCFRLSRIDSLPYLVSPPHDDHRHDQFVSKVEMRMMQGAIRVRRSKKSVRRIKAIHALHMLAEIHGYALYETRHNYWLIRRDVATRIRIVKYGAAQGQVLPMPSAP